ncbi:MAG: hypothetical protein LBU42_01605 [Prevotellaceae bacterium]|jgi:uncharacterized protein (TIGR02145 family)|nr:hypothetical protein [Prevotellaceae bacterium]
MKFIFFFLTLLAGISANAQTLNIRVALFDIPNKTVVCDLSWTGRNDRELSDVWVFVDYINVSGGMLVGEWKPATVTGATITKRTIGNTFIATVAGNKRGVWVKSVIPGADFTGQITIQLSDVPKQFNVCAYASDFPPYMTVKKDAYILHGSPPFTLIDLDEKTTQQVNGNSIDISGVTITPVTLTDRTGCPGIVFCPYPGDDLFIDATHLCRQRTSGQQNWEAWIRDRRDNELYRIVQMPDGKWWLAQNLKYTANGTMGVLFQQCGKDSCGIFYKQEEVFKEKGKTNYAANRQTVCPAGWILPSVDQWDNLSKKISSVHVAAWRDLRSWQSPCPMKTDKYGWATRGRCPIVHENTDGDSWLSTSGSRWIIMQIDNGPNNKLSCNNDQYWKCTVCSNTSQVAIRCMR